MALATPKAEGFLNNKEIPEHPPEKRLKLTHHRNTKATPIGSTPGGPDHVVAKTKHTVLTSLFAPSGLPVETYKLSEKTARTALGIEDAYSGL